MFGLFKRDNTGSEASILKAAVDDIVSKYMALPNDELVRRVQLDYPGSNFVEPRRYVAFVPSGLLSYHFSFSLPRPDDVFGRTLTVDGREEVAGFMLQVADHGWTVSVMDRAAYRATARAKKLAAVMVATYDITDLTDLLSRGRR